MAELEKLCNTCYRRRLRHKQNGTLPKTGDGSIVVSITGKKTKAQRRAERLEKHRGDKEKQELSGEDDENVDEDETYQEEEKVSDDKGKGKRSAETDNTSKSKVTKTNDGTKVPKGEETTKKPAPTSKKTKAKPWTFKSNSAFIDALCKPFQKESIGELNAMMEDETEISQTLTKMDYLLYKPTLVYDQTMKITCDKTYNDIENVSIADDTPSISDTMKEVVARRRLIPMLSQINNIVRNHEKTMEIIQSKAASDDYESITKSKKNSTSKDKSSDEEEDSDKSNEEETKDPNLENDIGADIIEKYNKLKGLRDKLDDYTKRIEYGSTEQDGEFRLKQFTNVFEFKKLVDDLDDMRKMAEEDGTFSAAIEVKGELQTISKLYSKLVADIPTLSVKNENAHDDDDDDTSTTDDAMEDVERAADFEVPIGFNDVKLRPEMMRASPKDISDSVKETSGMLPGICMQIQAASYNSNNLAKQLMESLVAEQKLLDVYRVSFDCLVNDMAYDYRLVSNTIQRFSSTFPDYENVCKFIDSTKIDDKKEKLLLWSYLRLHGMLLITKLIDAEKTYIMKSYDDDTFTEKYPTVADYIFLSNEDKHWFYADGTENVVNEKRQKMFLKQFFLEPILCPDQDLDKNLFYQTLKDLIIESSPSTKESDIIKTLRSLNKRDGHVAHRIQAFSLINRSGINSKIKSIQSTMDGLFKSDKHGSMLNLIATDYITGFWHGCFLLIDKPLFDVEFNPLKYKTHSRSTYIDYDDHKSKEDKEEEENKEEEDEEEEEAYKGRLYLVTDDQEEYIIQKCLYKNAESCMLIFSYMKELASNSDKKIPNLLDSADKSFAFIASPIKIFVDPSIAVGPTHKCGIVYGEESMKDFVSIDELFTKYNFMELSYVVGIMRSVLETIRILNECYNLHVNNIIPMHDSITESSATPTQIKRSWETGFKILYNYSTDRTCIWILDWDTVFEPINRPTSAQNSSSSIDKKMQATIKGRLLGGVRRMVSRLLLTSFNEFVPLTPTYERVQSFLDLIQDESKLSYTLDQLLSHKLFKENMSDIYSLQTNNNGADIESWKSELAVGDCTEVVEKNEKEAKKIRQKIIDHEYATDGDYIVCCYAYDDELPNENSQTEEAEYIRRVRLELFSAIVHTKSPL